MARKPPINNHAWPIFRSLASFRPAICPATIRGLAWRRCDSRTDGDPPASATSRRRSASLPSSQDGWFRVFGGNRFLSCSADSTIRPDLRRRSRRWPHRIRRLSGARGCPCAVVGVILVLGGCFGSAGSPICCRRR